MSLPINEAIFCHGLPLELFKGGYSVHAITLDGSPNYRDEGTFGIKPLHKLDPVELECQVIAFVE